MARRKNFKQEDEHAAHSGPQYGQTPLSPEQRPKATAANMNLPHISRNKHWRYISNYHGPWLQLPVNVLETLAQSNYYAPRPRPIDPAVFFDLVKIRRAVDEATELAVRAASGVTSVALSNSLASTNGMMNGAAMLGLTLGGNTPTTKLSKERKHRMREMATQKLAHAYHLDEIATSVATMQSTSSLEDVAHHVLQRNPNSYDARYVHFFHEKIPSRMMAEFTPLGLLDNLISERPHDPAPLRTRALTKLFKDDLNGALQDLTAGIKASHWANSQHVLGNDQLVPVNTVMPEKPYANLRDWKDEVRLGDDLQPSSSESQLLFHRAGVYLKTACQHIHLALDAWNQEQSGEQLCMGSSHLDEDVSEKFEPSKTCSGARERHHHFRKIVKTNAKRALRDYMAFLSSFEYSPGYTEAHGQHSRRSQHSESSFKSKLQLPPPTANHTQASLDGYCSSLTTYKTRSTTNTPENTCPDSPPLIIPLTQLFTPQLPHSSIPPYPPSSRTPLQERSTYHPLLPEALHALLLAHSILQTSPTELKRHALNAARISSLQHGYPVFLGSRSTARADWSEVLRLSGDWIELGMDWSRLCDRARWEEENEKDATAGAARVSGENEKLGLITGPKASTKDDQTKNGSALVTRAVKDLSIAPTLLHQDTASVAAKRRERDLHEAILDALADERVVDEATFHHAVRAREISQEQITEPGAACGSKLSSATVAMSSTSTASLNTENTLTLAGQVSGHASSGGTPTGSKWGTAQQQQKKDASQRASGFPGFASLRAEACARWVIEAPLVVEGMGGGKKKVPRKGRGGKGKSGVGRTEDEDAD